LKWPQSEPVMRSRRTFLATSFITPSFAPLRSIPERQNRLRRFFDPAKAGRLLPDLRFSLFLGAYHRVEPVGHVQEQGWRKA
jgi:hypothetical protein